MYCPKCGAQNDWGAEACVNCGGPLPQLPKPSDTAEDALSLFIPLNTSGWAIAATWAGMFSVFLFAAPFALIFSFLAFRDLQRNPHKRGTGRAIFGLIMGLVFSALLVVAIVGIVTSLRSGHP